MKIIKIGFLMMAFSLLLLNCKTAAQNTSIQSVSITNTFGRGGSTTITATKDSILSTAMGGRMREFPTVKRKNTAAEWQKLVTGIDTAILDKTTSGERRGVYDGPDEIFRIKTAAKEYEFYNVPEKSAGYKQLQDLKNRLQNLLPK